MGLLPDWMIERDIKIEPFAAQQSRPGVISYGVTSYGYDVRVGRKFKVFTNAHCAIVDPKNFDPKSFVDIEADSCLIPPNSFALAETVEYFEIPRDILAICLGKCLTGDARVVDAETGDYLPIRDFIEQKRQQTLGLGHWKIRPAAVADHIPNGVKPVFELRTMCGLKVKATENHPFRTIDGWTPLSELRPTDRIAVARSCPVFGRDEWPHHEAVLLGLLISDGQCRTPGSSPRYTTDDPRLVEALNEAAKRFGCEVSPVGYCGYNLVNRRGRGGPMTGNGNRVAIWLRELGCDCLSIHKRIPGTVFRAPRAAVATFLQALFSGDGSAYSTTSRKGTIAVCVEFASSSERLAEDVRHLLLRFGIFSLLRERESASGRTAYRIQITDIDMLRRFADEIGFIPGSKKQKRFEELLAAIADRKRMKSNFDTLPREFWEPIRFAARGAGRSMGAIAGRMNSRQSVPYGFAQAIGRATADPEILALVGADVVWDTVESVTALGEEPVYDIEVPDGNNFLANDIVVHNSTYARTGIIVNVTPLEPEWRGKVTIEISNTTPLPAKIYAGEGIAQILFHRAEQVCRTSYADKKGKYQDQAGLTLPFVQKG